MRIRVWSAVALVLLSSACGGPKPEIPDAKTDSKPDTSGIEISRDASDPVSKLAVTAIADLEQFWGKQYSDLYGSDFEPIKGGFFAAVPSQGDVPPCATDPQEVVARAAYYCSTEDVVAWDAENVLPELREKFGDFVIRIVFAHEYGHAIQARSNFTARSVTVELQADCFAGA
jgi:predicted metalloprotease